jgi:hypothetical protein
MSSPTGLKSEIFISYAHVDNGVLPGQTQGWVSAFDDALRTLLGGKISPLPKIWRDIELGKNDFITDTILEQVSTIAVMISILSPRYLDSEWCQREVRHFCDAAEKKRLSLKVGGKSRIVKVVKYPLLDKELPPAFSDLIGFEFFQLENNNLKAEFRLEFGADSAQKFLLKVNELADEIKSLMEAIKQHSATLEEQVDSSQKTFIYLAETTPDLEAERSNIKSDLLQRQYNVLPDRPLSFKASDFKEQVVADLARSKLSIHLIGKEYGFCPVGENRSIIELQHELAIARGKDEPDFAQLIWMPVEPETESARLEDIRKRRFVDLINSSLSSNAELLQKSLEDLKTVIQDKLNPAPKSIPLPVKAGSAPLIFVICNRLDSEAGKQLDDCLYELGYELSLPVFEGDQTEIHEDFQNKLLVCDAVLIYRGLAPDFWAQTKLRELQKIRSKRGPDPFLAQAIYIGGPPTEEKQRFRTREAIVIKHYDEISASSLEPFLNAIEQRRREQAS